MRTRGWVFLALIFFTDSWAQWISFRACGFTGITSTEYMRAPNIQKVWVRPEMVTSVYEFRVEKGNLTCVHLRISGAYDILVVGTPESVLKKLRGREHGRTQQ